MREQQVFVEVAVGVSDGDSHARLRQTTAVHGDARGEP
jgi:hypothetical protein